MTYDEIVTKMMSELTQEEIVNLASIKWWEIVGLEKAAYLQLNQRLFCFDSFEIYHEAVELLLGRSVLTCEIANPERLINEVLTGKSPTLSEIIDLLPKEKLIVINIDEERE